MSSQPWGVAGQTVYQLNDAGNENVWSANVHGPRLPYKTAREVAMKIAAAPDMYEALKEVMEWIANWDPNFTRDCEWLETETKARAALAKAGV